MRLCLGCGRRKSRKEVADDNTKLKRDCDEDDDMKGDVWFDSKLVFGSDSDDDFKSVNGDSLPSSFGHSYTSQETSRPSFTSLRDRMEQLVQEKAAHSEFVQPESVQNVPVEKRTLGQLFTAKPEQDRVLESEKKQSEIPRQGSEKGLTRSAVS